MRGPTPGRCQRRVTMATGPHPVEADLRLSVAGGEVGLGLRGGALGAHAVAHALVGTLGLLPALLVASLVGALGGAARTLAGAGGGGGGGGQTGEGVRIDTSERFSLRQPCKCLWNEKPASTCTLYWASICTSCCRAGWRHSNTGPDTGRCSRSRTPLPARPDRSHRWAGRTLEATISLQLNDCSTAAGRLLSYTTADGRTHKTVVSLLLQHVGDVVDAAHGELVVVELVPRRGSRIHDVIALLLHVLAFGFSWGAFRSRVVLRTRRRTAANQTTNSDKERGLIKFTRRAGI